MINLYAPSIINLDKSFNIANSYRKLRKLSHSCEMAVASPVFILGKPFPSFEDFSLVVDNINYISLQNKLPIKLFTGAVFAFDCDLTQVADTRFTIAKSRYMLVQLVGNIFPSFVYDVITEFGRRGIVCIIVGAEKHPYIKNHSEELSKLQSRGVLFLTDGSSICGIMGMTAKNLAFEMIENDTTSFIGGAMTERANNIIIKNFGFDKSEKLFYTNPGKVIYNQNLF